MRQLLIILGIMGGVLLFKALISSEKFYYLEIVTISEDVKVVNIVDNNDELIILLDGQLNYHPNRIRIMQHIETQIGFGSPLSASQSYWEIVNSK